MNNIQPYGAVSEEQVRKLERRYHIQLPAGYREFLLTYGGGDVEVREENRILIPDQDTYVSANLLFGFQCCEACQMIPCMDMFIDDMVENTLIIGEAIEHGFFILLCEGDEDAGAIYYWDHTYELESSSDECNTYWVADSFEEFLAMLETPKK